MWFALNCPAGRVLPENLGRRECFPTPRAQTLSVLDRNMWISLFQTDLPCRCIPTDYSTWWQWLTKTNPRSQMIHFDETNEKTFSTFGRSGRCAKLLHKLCNNYAHTPPWKLGRCHKYFIHYELWRNGYNSSFSSGWLKPRKAHYTHVDNTAIESERAWQENWNGWKTNDLKSICQKYDLAL